MNSGAVSEPILKLAGLTRHFEQPGEKLEVLKGVDLSIEPGEMVALVGPSGAGKSTLLQIAGLLEPPTSGEIWLSSYNASRMGDGDRTRLRRSLIGFVYQFHHLLPEFTALDNVAIPQVIAHTGRKAARERARELLDQVGLSHRLTHRPNKLSGGEQQRVAIARALANTPHLLLADEPTGNLDLATGDRVFDMLVELVHITKIGALVATHNLELARRMDRVVELRDGKLVDHVSE